jgi:hypothetical protein
MQFRFLRGLIPALVLAALPAISSAAIFVGVSVNLVPPALPVYVQPPCPEPGYIWTPGYWAWNDGAYYWVPGTWITPPAVGLLWTPGYWGWQGGAYYWHAGYWGPHVGFYGGVNYGFGYNGVGFGGGYWHGGVFMYNRAVVNVGPTFVTNVYTRPFAYTGAYAHVGFNGGPGGVVARPTAAQMVAAHEHHIAFTAVQQRQQRMAFANRSLRADYNHGRPAIAATARAGVFRGNGVVGARAAGGPMRTASMRSIRSDRPPGASGQNHASRPTGHATAMHRQAPRTQEHFQQRPQARQSFRPQARPQARPQSHQAPHPQQRGGGGHRPPENHGGGHNR